MSRSKFPNQIDTFEELYDLPPSLVVSAKRYQELKIKPTLNAIEQAELNKLSTELGNYIITPETWNKLADSLVNVETFFKEEVDDYIQLKQEEWNGYIKGFKSVGAYDATAVYTFSNMVTYKGVLFLCIANSTKGVAPSLNSNTNTWQQISSKGEKGDVGLNIFLKGEFSEEVLYKVGDAVTFEGKLYYCIKDTAAGTTPADISYWFLYEGTVVSPTEPAGSQTGTFWIEVIE